MQKQIIEKITALLSENKIEYSKNEPLKNHTTFKIGGAAAVFCTPDTQEKLKTVFSFVNKEKIPYFILGKGSNTLFDDEGFDGVIICYAKNNIETDGCEIYADSGVQLSALCRAAQQAGLTGLEFAYGIPGNVGGAVYMNAGAYGGEIKDCTVSVDYLSAAENGECTFCNLPAENAGFAYRRSVFEDNGGFILGARFKLERGNPEEINNKMKELMAKRREKQPLEYPSAGSTFKRPVGAYAGALIEQCGLRGFSVGGAQISEKHCGFVVNKGEATCDDVVKLTEIVIKTVKEKTGFLLEREVKIIKP